MAALTTPESQAALPLEGAAPVPRRHTRNGRPFKTRPFKTPRPDTLSNVRIMVDDLQVMKGLAAEMGLPMRDFWAWAAYRAAGMEIPEYIQSQIDAAAAAAEQAAFLEEKRAS